MVANEFICQEFQFFYAIYIMSVIHMLAKYQKNLVSAFGFFGYFIFIEII